MSVEKWSEQRWEQLAWLVAWQIRPEHSAAVWGVRRRQQLAVARHVRRQLEAARQRRAAGREAARPAVSVALAVAVGRLVL